MSNRVGLVSNLSHHGGETELQCVSLLEKLQVLSGQLIYPVILGINKMLQIKTIKNLADPNSEKKVNPDTKKWGSGS